MGEPNSSAKMCRSPRSAGRRVETVRFHGRALRANATSGAPALGGISAEGEIHASARIPEMSSAALTMIERLIARGVREKRLSADLDGPRLYISMVALSQFHLSNVHTLLTIFGRDLSDPNWRRERLSDARRMLAQFLLCN